MEVLQNRTERERVFGEMLELFDHQLDYDWFSDYFQENFADAKEDKFLHRPIKPT